MWGLFLSLPVQANSPLENVLITANRETTSVQGTPASVSVVGGSTLQDYQATDLRAATKYTSGLFVSSTTPLSGSSNSAAIYMRGVGQSEFLLTNDPGIAIYTDGVYMPRSQGAVVDMLDIQRVEVLRGPQGLLYGRNALGGAIHVISNKPDLSTNSLALTLVAGEYNRQEASFTANLAVNSTTALRIAAASRTADGYVKRLADGKELGDQDDQQIRGSLIFEPTDTLGILFQFDSSRERGNSAPSVLGMNSAEEMTALTNQSTLVGLYNNVVGRNAPSPAPCCASDAQYDGRYFLSANDETWATGPHHSQFDSIGTSLTIDWNTTLFAFKSTTAFRKFDTTMGRDADQSPLTIIHTQNEIDHDQISQEFQLSGNLSSRLRAIAGLYYFEETGRDKLKADIIPSLYSTVGIPLSVHGYYDINNRSKAVFGELIWDVNDQWQLSGGVRRTIDDKGYNNNVYLLDTATPVVPTGPHEKSFSDWTGGLTIKYQLNTDAMFYASVANGFKSGGYVARYVVPVPRPLTFGEEKLKTLEVGLKTSWYNHQVTANLSAYYSDYDDIQLLVFQGVTPVTENAGNGRMSGTEIDIGWRITDHWEWHNQISYLDTDYLDLNPTASVTRSDAFAYSPQWSAASRVEYKRTINKQLTLRASLNYHWQSEMALDAINTSQLMQGSYGVVDGNIILAGDNNFQIKFYGLNLTNTEYRYSGTADLPSFGAVETTWSRPREIGVALTLEY